MNENNDGFSVAFLILLTGMIAAVIVSAPSSAYEIRVDTPSSIIAGVPLLVKVTTNLPTGTTVPIIFGATNRPLEFLKEYVTVQGAEPVASVVFPTDGLLKGIYKVEALPVGQYKYQGDSKSMVVVEVVNRDNSIEFTSPTTEYIRPDNMYVFVSGVVKENKNSGIGIEVTSLNGSFSAPLRYYPTDNAGKFSVSFYLTTTDTLKMVFLDGDGYITTRMLDVYWDQTIYEPLPVIPDPTPEQTIMQTPPTSIPPTQPPVEISTTSPTTVATTQVMIGVVVVIVMIVVLFMFSYWIFSWIRKRIRKRFKSTSVGYEDLLEW